MIEFGDVKYDAKSETETRRLGSEITIVMQSQYIYSKLQSDDVITDNGLKHLFTHHDVYRRRSSIPCQSAFAALRCDDAELYNLYCILHWISPRMINPFVILPAKTLTLPHLARLVQWTHKNALHRSSPTEIASAYLAFILKIDKLLEGSEVNKAYDLAQATAELKRI